MALSATALDLLKMLHRAKQNQQPRIDEMQLRLLWHEAAELRNEKFAVNFGATMVITEAGEAFLLSHKSSE